MFVQEFLRQQISIHAPTRGATVFFQVLPNPLTISIHAPTRGATFQLLLILLTHKYFNPRSHKGSDEMEEETETRLQ